MTSPRRHSLAATALLGLAALGFASCGSAEEALQERMAEAALGGDVDIDFDNDGGSFSIQTDEDSFSFDMDEDDSGQFSFEGEDDGGTFDFEDNDDGFTITSEEGTAVFSDDGGDNGSFEFSDDDENFSLNSGSDLPNNFPFTVPDGGELSVISSDSAEGSSTIVSVMYDGDRFDQLADLYRSEASRFGDVDESTMTNNGERTLILASEDESLFLSVGVTNGDTMVSIYLFDQ